MSSTMEEKLQIDFWDNMSEMWGYDIIGSESHPLKKAFELYCEMKKEKDEDEDKDSDEDTDDDSEDDDRCTDKNRCEECTHCQRTRVCDSCGCVGGCYLNCVYVLQDEDE